MQTSILLRNRQIGRLAWRSPAGAMLWEICSRHRWGFALQGFSFLLGIAFVYVHRHGVPASWREIIFRVPTTLALICSLSTLGCFCYAEIDGRRAQSGIPTHLFLRPVGTAKLVAVVMGFGGMGVTTVFLLWVQAVLRPLGYAIDHLRWFTAVVLCAVWGVQAVAWSTRNLPWGVQIFLVTMVAGSVALVGILPIVAGVSTAVALAFLGLLCVSAVSLAVSGVKKVRRGDWEGGGVAVRPQPRTAQKKLKRFTSMLQAQFWLEWQRLGLRLPTYTVIGLALIFLLNHFIRMITGLPRRGTDEETLQVVQLVLITPILCSLLPSNLSGFDRTHIPAVEIPAFVGTRPVQNGDLVMAKLAVALATSAFAWLIVAFVTPLWLALCGSPSILSSMTRLSSIDFVGLVMMFILLTLFVGRNIAAGLWVGLGGRPALNIVVSYLRWPFYAGAGRVLGHAKENQEFRALLLPWIPWAVPSLLVVKLAVSFLVFGWGMRHNAITGRAVLWITIGWFSCGLLLSVMALAICMSLALSKIVIWIAAAGFLFVPLAELALAPWALTWNRHR